MKVLDFGLAKAIDPAGRRAWHVAVADDHDACDDASRDDPRDGGVHVSGASEGPDPGQEQRHLVVRCVLLEMLTGKPVFAGETVSHVMAAVLRADPDWSALPPNTPAPIRRVLRRCLDKAPNRRLDSAAAVRLELEDAQTGPAAEVSPARVPRRVVPVAIASFFGGGASSHACLVDVYPACAACSGTIGAVHNPPPAALPLTLSLQAAARDFAVAPDGSFLIYRSGHAGQLVVRWLDQLDAAPLTGIKSAVMPFVSP